MDETGWADLNGFFLNLNRKIRSNPLNQFHPFSKPSNRKATILGKKQTFAHQFFHSLMKILLATLNAKYIHTNLAIRLLYQLNREQHEGLQWREFTIKEDRDEVARACAEFDIVAFSCYIWNITQTLDAARKIKLLRPDVRILLGGPEVSYDWEDVIVRPEVDFIITGEGEIPFENFLENYPAVEHIPNLIRKTEGGGIAYFQQTETFDLERLRDIQPYSFDSPDEIRNKVLYLETSRGCPYKCEFCLASLDNKVRYLPMESIKNTLFFMMQHGRVVKFLDRTFNLKRDFTLEVFRFILENHRPKNVFQFEITADILHPDIIKFVDEQVPHGLFRFEIGIQTVNQKANLEVSRKQNFEKTKHIIRSLEHKVEMHLDLIVGLALDYWDDVRFSFEEVFRLHPPELQLGFLKFLKGTPVRHKHEQHGFVFDPEPPYQIIESKYLSRQELFDLEVLENALEIYWNKKRICRALKYVDARYSVFDFLLNLGKFFLSKKEFHQYTLEDAYQIAVEFAEANFSDDLVLKELMAVDYFLYPKKKPKVLFLNEIANSDKDFVIRQIENLENVKRRYLAFELSFDINLFEQTGEVLQEPSLFVVQYNGVDKAEVVNTEKFELAY